MLLNKLEPLLKNRGYFLSATGGLYRIGGAKIGICAFDWQNQQHSVVRQVNFYHTESQTPEVLELKTYLVIHDIGIKDKPFKGY